MLFQIHIFLYIYALSCNCLTGTYRCSAQILYLFLNKFMFPTVWYWHSGGKCPSCRGWWCSRCMHALCVHSFPTPLLMIQEKARRRSIKLLKRSFGLCISPFFLLPLRVCVCVSVGMKLTCWHKNNKYGKFIIWIYSTWHKMRIRFEETFILTCAQKWLGCSYICLPLWINNFQHLFHWVQVLKYSFVSMAIGMNIFRKITWRCSKQ